MAKRSEAWKNLERSVALEARGVGFGRAFRVCRGDDIGISATDVIIPEIPFVKIDTKYRANGFKHHALFFEAEKKYCTQSGDFMVLPTKGARERGSLATVRTEVLMQLLADKYLTADRPSNTLGCPQCSSVAVPKPAGLGLAECTCTSCGLSFFLKSTDVPEEAYSYVPGINSYAEEYYEEEHPLEVSVLDELIEKAPRKKRTPKK